MNMMRRRAVQPSQTQSHAFSAANPNTAPAAPHMRERKLKREILTCYSMQNMRSRRGFEAATPGLDASSGIEHTPMRCGGAAV